MYLLRTVLNSRIVLCTFKLHYSGGGFVSHGELFGTKCFTVLSMKLISRTFSELGSFMA